MPRVPNETVDLMGVELMAAGERVFGQGSAPQGDVYTEDDLARIASDTNDVINELRPFVKIGHSSEQKLAKASGLYDDAENPATGWPRNFRVEGGKLKADLMAMPKKLSLLVEHGAFRTRSPEVRTYKDKSVVVQAVSLLGAKPPAFKTLDDIHALYNQGDPDPATVMRLYMEDEALDDDEVKVVEYAAGDVAWDPELGTADLMEDINEVLNPEPPGPPSMDECCPKRYWCMDVMLSNGGGRALVRDNESDYDMAWIVPFTLGADGDPVPADYAEWVLAQQAWIERAVASNPGVTAQSSDYAEWKKKRDAADGSQEVTPASDTTPRMPTENDNNEGEVTVDTKLFAEALGLPETATAEEIAAKGRELREASTAPPVDDDAVVLSKKDYAEVVSMARQGATAAETLRQQTRDHLIDGAIKDCKLNPGGRDEWIKRYDEAPVITAAIIEELPVQEALKAQALGRDGDGGEGPWLYDEAEEASYRYFCESQGLPYVPSPGAIRAYEDSQRRTDGVRP